jgi:hypothetical protein
MTEYILIAVFVLYVVSESFHRIERTRLLNRLMARDLPQFKYYEDKWKGDLKEIAAVREETREELKEEKKEAAEEDDPDSLY